MQAWLRTLKPRKMSAKTWERTLDTAVQRQLEDHEIQAQNETLQAWNAICSHVQDMSSTRDQVLSLCHWLISLPLMIAQGLLSHIPKLQRGLGNRGLAGKRNCGMLLLDDLAVALLLFQSRQGDVAFWISACNGGSMCCLSIFQRVDDGGWLLMPMTGLFRFEPQRWL